MTQQPDHRIRTEAELREIIGEPLPGLDLKIQDHLDEFATAFIARTPFLLLSTANAEGRQDVSPKGDGPGFLLVEYPRTLVIPDRLGNRLVFGHLNILANPRVGLLLMIPGTNETLRINGAAKIIHDPAALEPLAVNGKAPKLGIVVQVRECYLHCARSVIRSGLWQREQWPDATKLPAFARMLADQVDLEDQTETSLAEMIKRSYSEGLY